MKLKHFSSSKWMKRTAQRLKVILMIDITEFTSILVLMCEWYLTGKNTERHCLCEQRICVFTGKVVLVILR